MMFYNMQFNSCSGGSKDNNMSYIDNTTLRQNAELKLNTFSTEAFHINNILQSMENMYIEGALEYDQKWRNALKRFKENHEDKFTNRDIMEIIKYLNE